MGSLLDRMRDLRNRVIAKPEFQRWAASFPLSRPMVRKRTSETFNMAVGFSYAQVLRACVELDVFETLRDGPLPLADFAARIDLPEEGADRLARAAVALSLLERRRDGYALGLYGAALLGNPAVFPMIKHHGALYADLCDPVALLRQRTHDTALARFWNYDEGGSSPYSALMATTQAFISAEILSAFSFKGFEHVMDVAGGAGAFLCALKEKRPEMKATLCDLENVAPIARQNFADKGIDVRVAARNIHDDALPVGADIITLIRVLHDHDDERVHALLKSVHSALPAGGTVLVAEPMAKTRGAEPMGDAYFGLYLWAMGSGRPRSKRELSAFLCAAGFRRPREVKTNNPILTRILVAERD
ncbi:MAG: methyltransferase [Pseudomonadota bacterium]